MSFDPLTIAMRSAPFREGTLECYDVEFLRKTALGFQGMIWECLDEIQRLQIEAATEKPPVILDKPNGNGLYWQRDNDHSKWVVLEVHDKYVFHGIEWCFSVDDAKGEWVGPLSKPSVDVKVEV